MVHHVLFISSPNHVYFVFFNCFDGRIYIGISGLFDAKFCITSRKVTLRVLVAILLLVVVRTMHTSSILPGDWLLALKGEFLVITNPAACICVLKVSPPNSN